MIAATGNKVQYSPAGATTVFAFTFLILAQEHLVVILTTAGVDATLVLGTNYTVSGIGIAAGGSITCVVPPAAGTTLTIRRVVPLTQLADYVVNDRFSAEVHEAALDKLTMSAQQIQESIERSLRFPESEPVSSNAILSAKTARVNTLMGFDASGNMYLWAINPVTLALTVPTIIDTAHLANLAVTAAKLAAVLDLSGKTVTLPANSVTEAMLTTVLNLTGHSVVLPQGMISSGNLINGIVGLDKTNPSTRIEKRLRIGFGRGIDGLGGGTPDPCSLTVSGAGVPAANGTYVKGADFNVRSTWVLGTITIRWNAVFSWWEFYDSAGALVYWIGAELVYTPEQVSVWEDSGGGPIPTVELDTATERLEVNGGVRATRFLGDGSQLTGFTESIATLQAGQNGGTRTSYRGLAVITSRGELWTAGDDATYVGRGGHGNAIAFTRLKRALFKAGVDAITFPVTVTDLLDGFTDTVVQVKQSWNNTFALSAAGILYACGANASGQLGQGDTTARNYFSSIRFGASAATNKAIVSFDITTSETGLFHCAAIDTDGQVWVWGYNAQGQLGLNDAVQRTRPVKLSSSDATWATRVATQVCCVGSDDGSTFILTSTGTLWGTGYNSVGQLCRGNFTANFLTFVQVNTITGITRVWARGRYSGAASVTSVYATKTDNTLYSWGYNGHGELGNGNLVNQNTAQIVSANAAKFAVGGDQAGYCVLVRTDNTVRTWGYNNNGQLGDTTQIDKNVPTVPAGIDATKVANGGGCKKVLAAGGDTGSALVIVLNNGDVYVAGFNTKGVLGTGDSTGKTSFAKSFFSRSTLIDLVESSGDTECNLVATYSDKTCWGSGENATGHMSFGQLGDAWIPQRITL